MAQPPKISGQSKPPVWLKKVDDLTKPQTGKTGDAGQTSTLPGGVATDGLDATRGAAPQVKTPAQGTVLGFMLSHDQSGGPVPLLAAVLGMHQIYTGLTNRTLPPEEASAMAREGLKSVLDVFKRAADVLTGTMNVVSPGQGAGQLPSVDPIPATLTRQADGSMQGSLRGLYEGLSGSPWHQSRLLTSLVRDLGQALAPTETNPREAMRQYIATHDVQVRVSANGEKISLLPSGGGQMDVLRMSDTELATALGPNVPATLRRIFPDFGLDFTKMSDTDLIAVIRNSATEVNDYLNRGTAAA